MSVQLAVLNSTEGQTSITYLPNCFTSVKVAVFNSSAKAYDLIVRPTNLSSKRFIAHESTKDGKASNSEDLTIIWGGGMEKGYVIKALPKSKSNLFFMVLHDSDSLAEYSVELEAIEIEDSREKKIASATVNLRPPKKVTSCAKMITRNQGVFSRQITFEGKRLASYVSRWFSKGRFAFTQTKFPEFVLEYKETNGFVSGEVSVLMKTPSGIVQVGRISGDVEGSNIHAELYSFAPNFSALRLWFYWVTPLHDKNPLIGGIGEGSNKSTELQEWKNKTTEIPDIERFDLIINNRSKKIIYLCTDLHWRETWWAVNGTDPIELKFAGIETIPLMIKNLPQLLGPLLERRMKGEEFDPSQLLRRKLRSRSRIEFTDMMGFDEDIANQNPSTLGRGLHRKHVPYALLCNLMPEYTSNVVTEL